MGGGFKFIRKEAVEFASKDQSEDIFLIPVQKYAERTAITCAAQTMTVEEIEREEGTASSRVVFAIKKSTSTEYLPLHWMISI
jgi:hypothetical protein